MTAIAVQAGANINALSSKDCISSYSEEISEMTAIAIQAGVNMECHKQ